jgi:hypothetical protein
MGRFMKAPNAEQVVGEALEDPLKRRAQAIVDNAQRRIPKRTGRLARSLRVTVDDQGVVAESSSSFFHLIESGSVNNNPPPAPLRTAASDAGRFEPK